MRNYEGTIRLQGIGIVEGIKAINLQVGDERVYNFGGTEKVTAIEQTKTGKSVKVTFKYFDKMSKVIDGVWVGEWKEYTKTIGVNTIVAVKELNPVEVVQEVSEVEQIKTESQQAINSINTEIVEGSKQDNIIINKLENLINDSFDLNKIIDSEEQRASIRLYFKRLLATNKYTKCILSAYKDSDIQIDFINSFTSPLNLKLHEDREKVLNSIRRAINQYHIVKIKLV